VRRGHSAAAAAPAPERTHALVSEILTWKHDYALVAALLGPPGTGKTALLEKAAEAARQRKFHAEHIDFIEAREIWDVDEFYWWLVRKLRDRWWRDVPGATSARLGFCAMLGRALIQRRNPVLLALDHVDSLPEACANQLVSDLREIQNNSESGGAWGRLRCVVAGCVSVFELRRRVNSPNLQFRLHILPNGSSGDAVAETQRHIAASGRLADEAVIRFLAQQTGGEPGFLAALDNYLPASEIDMAAAERAASLWLKNASQHARLSRPAALYLLDKVFKENADRILDGVPVGLASPPTDIDRYQLAGAWVTHADRSQPRFRNGLVERLIRGVRAYPADNSVDKNILEISRLQKFALGAGDMAVLLDCVGDAWRTLSGLDGSSQLVLFSRKTAFAMDGASVSQVEVPKYESVESNGHAPAAVTVRAGREWLVDTHWPGPEAKVVVRVRPDKAFLPSVATRELLRLWALFLQPLEQTSAQAALQALGSFTLEAGLNAWRKKVFVSSTYLDLVSYRRAVLEQLVRRDLLFRGMEFFGAEPASPPPAEKIVREVHDADVYLGIFGTRYGSVDPKSGLSMTELEFNEAESSGKQMLLYVMSGDAHVRASDFDAETEDKRKALLNRVKKHTVYQFATIEDLGRQVYEDLGKL